MPKTMVKRAGLFAIALLLLPVPARLAPSVLSRAVSGYTDPGAISAEQIAGHIAFLASDKLQGRRAGSPGAEEAARYIADRFKAYGLSPATSSGFLEPFSFVSGVRLGPGNTFTVKMTGTAVSLKVGEQFMP